MAQNGNRIQITYESIDRLKPYKNNPRKNDPAVDSVARSIREFGFKNPIVLGKDYEIVCGHTRLKAALQLGMTEVPCVSADDLTDEQIRAYRLADNKTNELSLWDPEMLAVELNEINMDMSVFGFDINPMDGTPDDELDVAADEPLPENPVTRPGDLWLLGKHRVLCGDATSADDVARLMDGHAAHLVVTDPPYNVDYSGLAGTIMNDKQSGTAFYEFLLGAFQNMHNVSRAGAAIYVFHADSQGLIFRRAFEDAGYTLRQCLIWVKNNHVLGRQDYQWRHEPILYSWKDGATHYFIDDRTQSTVIEEDQVEFDKMRKVELLQYIKEHFQQMEAYSTVLHVDKPARSDLHPTMKPVALVGQLIRNSSKTNWGVLDPFGGSGSTLLACEQLLRRCYMMELDPRYCDVIARRYHQYLLKFKQTERPDEVIHVVRDGHMLTLDEAMPAGLI